MAISTETETPRSSNTARRCAAPAWLALGSAVLLALPALRVFRLPARAARDEESAVSRFLLASKPTTSDAADSAFGGLQSTTCVAHSVLTCINGRSGYWPKCDPGQAKDVPGPPGFEYGYYCTEAWVAALNNMLTTVGLCQNREAIHKLLAQVAYETGYFSTVFQPADGGAGLIHMIPANWPFNAKDMDVLWPGQGYSDAERAEGRRFFQQPRFGWRSVAAWFKRTNRVISGCGLDLFNEPYDTQTRCILGRVVDRHEAFEIVADCLQAEANRTASPRAAAPAAAATAASILGEVTAESLLLPLPMEEKQAGGVVAFRRLPKEEEEAVPAPEVGAVGGDSPVTVASNASAAKEPWEGRPCSLPPGSTCQCPDPRFPCYAPSFDGCSCWGIKDEAACKAAYGTLCQRSATCVPHCSLCISSTACQQCVDGYVTIGGRCAVEAPSAAERWLKAHNIFRCMHGAPAVTWSAAAAGSAQLWANHITKLEHSNSFIERPPAGPAAENLAEGTYTIESSVEGWYSELSLCSAMPGCDGGAELTTREFTAIIWRGVTEIGCASNTREPRIDVCRYRSGDSLGPDTANMPGHFQENVWQQIYNLEDCIAAIEAR